MDYQTKIQIKLKGHTYILTSNRPLSDEAQEEWWEEIERHQRETFMV